MTLKEYLQENGQSLTAFGMEHGISVPMLSMILSGDRRPSPEMAERIENATSGKVSRIDLLYPKTEAKP